MEQSHQQKENKECNPSDGFPTQETEEGMKLMHINDETGERDSSNGYSTQELAEGTKSVHIDDKAKEKISLPVKGDQPDITAILNDREILFTIAGLLEQGHGTDLQALAYLCGVNDLSKLKAVVPCRNFFKNLAYNKGDITLADLKALIERTLRLKNKSVFPVIEGDIKNGKVKFTLKSTLTHLIGNSHDWLYFLKNVADKLLKNNCQLTSWEDIAGHYKYTYQEIKAFTTNFEDERPTEKLLQYLASNQMVLSIEALKGHLKSMNRYDIVRSLDAWLARSE